MKDFINYISNNSIRLVALVLLLLSCNFSNASSDNSTQNVDEGMDSLLISVQHLMLHDSTSNLLLQESIMLKLLMTEYEDFYSLTKNLFLLDYNLERSGDVASRSILRYWMGYYMKSQKLMDNALELWKGIDNDLPSFLLPQLYLNKGEVHSYIGDYSKAIDFFEKVDGLENVNDSLLWLSKKQLAQALKEQGKFEEEISVWQNNLVWLGDKDRIDWIIFANKSLADAYRNVEDYSSAIIYLNKANDFHQSYNPNSPDLYQYYVDIALIFELQGNNSKSLGYLKTASKEMRKAGNDFSEAEISYHIAYIYFGLDKTDQSREYNDKAIRISSKRNFDELLMRAYYLSYQIDERLNMFENALKDYSNYSELRIRFNDEEKEILRDTYQKQYQIERAEKQYKLIIASEELKDFELEQFRLEKEKTEAQLDLLQEQKTKKEIELKNQTLEANEVKNQLEFEKQNREADKQSSEIRDLEKEKQINLLIINEQKSKQSSDILEIETLTQENKNKELMLEIEINKRNRVRWFSLLAVIIAVLIGILFWSKRKENKVLSGKNKEIEYQHREIEIKNKKLAEEKGKTDSLLLNILPQETADELKSTGKALPKVYDNVSVLFTDFSGFTSLTEKMDPRLVLNNLELMFTRFDDIASENDMERIKTIGDGYMCAGGLPLENKTHPIDAVRTGLKYLTALEEFNVDQKELGKPEWKLRVGINSGKVVAGVIGKRKFAYDIWGDTVNLASRAESHGILNKVNITENTYLEIKDVFDCEYRGEVDVKNIGKVKMYIVLGEKGIA